MTKRMPRLLPLLAALLALPACSTLRITTDWDHAADFSRYRTFRWAPTQKTDDYRTGDVSLLDARIRRVVNEELRGRGMELREGTGATDLLLVYRVSSRDRVDVYRYGAYRRPYGRMVDVYQYREGTLLLMMVDPELDQVVWEGAAVGAVAGSPGEEKIAKAVKRILEDYPPQ